MNASWPQSPVRVGLRVALESLDREAGWGGGFEWEDVGLGIHGVGGLSANKC